MSVTSYPDRRCPLVSVIVPTYGRDEVLCDTLRGLLSQDYPRYEVIVVSQATAHTEGTRKFFMEHRDRIRVLRLDRPSLPNARNVGILDAQGEIILFVDDDVIPSSSLISWHVSAYSDPSVVGVAGQVLSSNGVTVSATEVGRLDRFTNATWNFHSSLRTYAEYANGANMSFRRDRIVDAGLFEPAFGGNAYYEDTDLSLRIQHPGEQIIFEPRASLIHLEAKRGGCGNRNRNPRWYYWYMHNSMLFALRHRDRFDPLGVLMFHARKISGELKDPLLLPLWLVAAISVQLSYLRSRQSLAGYGYRMMAGQRSVRLRKI